MVVSEFESALNQVCAERGISPELVIASIETALISAYRKDFGGSEEGLTAKVDPVTGEAHIFQDEKVTSSVKDVTPSGFGRIAAQTAKQVILQKIREDEKAAIIKEYEKKVGMIVTGHIFRVEKGVVIVDLGRTQGVMPQSEQVPNDNYQLNQRTKAIVTGVREGMRGPEVVISRADPRFIKELFALEVPEVASGVVKIEAIAREAGIRTKMAVSSSERNVDPVGSCVGQKGVRVQAVIAEVGSEKIDIVSYSEMTDKFIAAALSPAKVVDVVLDSTRKEAKVYVAEDQLSLAIGREGQNVRLAARMTGWRIDIRGPEKEAEVKAEGGEAEVSAGASGNELVTAGISTRVANILAKAGITTLAALKEKTPEQLAEIKGLGPKAKEEISKVINASK